MISINLTGNERLQFQYILPVQGSLLTLRTVEIILEKIDINNVKDINECLKIDFGKEEISFIKEMINFLDEQKKLNFQSLSLINKILNIKETK